MNEDSVTQLLRKVIAPLASKATAGDRASAIELVCAAHAVCMAVESFRDAQPILAREIGRKMDSWPALAARHIAARRNLDQILVGLQLSEDHPDKDILAPDGKGPDLDNEYNSVAIDIRDFLVRLRGPRFEDDPMAQAINSLVPATLTPDSFESWWSYGWDLFLKLHNGDPFKDARLLAKFCSCEQQANYEGISVVAYVERPVKQAAKTLWLYRFR